MDARVVALPLFPDTLPERRSHVSTPKATAQAVTKPVPSKGKRGGARPAAPITLPAAFPKLATPATRGAPPRWAAPEAHEEEEPTPEALAALKHAKPHPRRRGGRGWTQAEADAFAACASVFEHLPSQARRLRECVKLGRRAFLIYVGEGGTLLPEEVRAYLTQAREELAATQRTLALLDTALAAAEERHTRGVLQPPPRTSTASQAPKAKKSTPSAPNRPGRSLGK